MPFIATAGSSTAAPWVSAAGAYLLPARFRLSSLRMDPTRFPWAPCCGTDQGLPFAQEGLAVLQADGKVFQCHDTIDDTVWHSELGASLAIMEVGCVYSIVFSYDTILRS